MKLYAVDTGYFKLDGGAMFGVVPKTIWGKLIPSDGENNCSWAMRCLLIEDGNRLILVDNGIGTKQDAKFFSYYHLHGKHSLDSSLYDLGFSRDDVTDVFLTHLHFDHCGGSIELAEGKLRPAFMNALYWCNERHWKWATEPNDREKASFLKENILPIMESGQLRMVEIPGNIENDRTEFSPEIQIRFVSGHTDCMMLPQIRYKDRVVVFVSDLLPSSLHIPLPYIMAYDMFPMTTLSEKKSFLKEAAEHGYILFYEHDPQVECSTVKWTERGVRPGDTLFIKEL
jgi:glyoxylase-like metal-dependent hydrolase (beta-lactamase superfamily II)